MHLSGNSVRTVKFL